VPELVVFISMHWLSETLDSIYTHITEPCLQHPSDDRLDSIHRLSSELASSPSSAFSGYGGQPQERKGDNWSPSSAFVRNTLSNRTRYSIWINGWSFHSTSEPFVSAPLWLIRVPLTTGINVNCQFDKPKLTYHSLDLEKQQVQTQSGKPTG